MPGTSFASSFVSILALALGLAMDATAVAGACGVATPVLRARHFATVAVYFGGFQALMPLLGWRLATWLGPAMAAWDHWIAFVLLGGIGAKMILDAWRAGRGGGGDGGGGGGGDGGGAGAGEARGGDVFRARVMLGLAVATSIDAFAAGITLPMFEVPIAISLATIGLTTAAAAALGLAVGRRLGARLGRRLDVLGGLVLIGLGTKLLVEHLAA
jgi:putative Mn2+ efflux pump MntP